MNWRVYLLAVSTFAVGLVELVVGGILPSLAEDLNVSLATAGLTDHGICDCVCYFSTGATDRHSQNRTKASLFNRIIGLYIRQCIHIF